MQIHLRNIIFVVRWCLHNLNKSVLIYGKTKVIYVLILNFHSYPCTIHRFGSLQILVVLSDYHQELLQLSQTCICADCGVIPMRCAFYNHFYVQHSTLNFLICYMQFSIAYQLGLAAEWTGCSFGFEWLNSCDSVDCNFS